MHLQIAIYEINDQTHYQCFLVEEEEDKIEDVTDKYDLRQLDGEAKGFVVLVKD